MLAGGADPGSAHWFLEVLVNACEDRTAWAVFQCCIHRGAQLLFGQMVLIAQTLGRVEAFSVVCGSFVVRAEIRARSLGSQGYEGSNVPALSCSESPQNGAGPGSRSGLGARTGPCSIQSWKLSGVFVNAAEAVCLIALWPCF